ncbi:non-ribosomal peptide synthetase [Xylanimonas protaetiae]|uniref:non-ribosomal peptide synthetase n=1 Tax=Xylanimonas protaetiae TaxID=2509457 RepID=UPI0013EA187E|nr:non-ribosomal peptide synthetase [Xylanimonas protaetiae]
MGFAAATPVAGVHAGAWLALTAAQRGLFFAHQLAPANPCYTTAEVVELDGAVDPERLRYATAAAYREFEQLRVAFRLTAQGPQQRVQSPRAPALRVVEVADAAAATAWLDADLARPMDLVAGDVARSALLVMPGATWWYHAAHHAVLDGYGAQQLLRRVAALYDGAAPRDPEVTLAELVAADPRQPGSEDFWAARLAAMTGTASLAGRTAPPAARAARHAVDVDDAVQHALVAAARRLGTTWADLFTVAVGTYTARMTGTPSARVGMPLMNRSLPGTGALPSARTVCTAMNVLPATVPGTGTLAAALAAARGELDALRAHPFERQEDLARRLARTSGAQLFGTQVNVLPFDLELRLGAAAGTVRNLTAGPVEDLTVALRGTPGRGRRVRLEIDANPALYDAAELGLHADRLLHWLGVCAAAGPDDDVEHLPLMPEAERRLVVAAFNDTTVQREAATLGRRFLDQARATPDATALVFRGERRTYGQLLDAARRVAAGLAARGVGPGDVVAVRLDRSLELFAVVHGIALRGAVYLPLDPDVPAARAATMLRDAAAVLVVDGGSVPDAAPLVEDAVHDDVTTPAYVLFTSGSTGRPKGVVVGHAAIDNRLAWMQHHLRLAPGQRVAHKTPLSFDVSVWELFWPLQVGATVVVAEPGAHRDPRALADLLVGEGVGVVHFVPSMLRALLADRPARERLRSGVVRAVVTSGEALTADLVSGSVAWFGVAPVNLYGPTEAAVDVTVWDTVPGEEPVPIGRPVWNTSCLVLDAAGGPVPVGVTGELWLGGVQLADGYASRPELTAERFVSTPFGRLYRTGDLAAWRPDGALRYLGRTDDQVKVRGQRVELGEVEAAVAGTPGVTASAAGVVDGQLVVWFVPEDAGADGVAVARGALLEAARRALPPSFVPTHWVPVGEVPLSASGKTDRRTLAAAAPLVAVTDHGTGPGDLLEQRLCALVADVLGVGAVPADADFFDLGGDSLRVLRLLAAVEDDLGTTLSLADVFAHPSPAALARLLRAGTGGDGLAEVLTLRPGTAARPPLFLLPPAGGLGWCYTGLLPGLPRDLAVHTVQAPGVQEGAPEPAHDLEGLARRQLAAVRSVVGDGAFHVAGWSLGGMAAHAVAALARAEGQAVGAVVLLDAYPSEQWSHLAEPTAAEALLGILRLAGLDAPVGVPLDRDVVATLLRGSGSALAQLPATVLDGCVASVVESARLVRSGTPRVLDGGLTVVVAGAPRPETHLVPTAWERHVTGEVRVVALDATHGDLVRRPVADAVAAVLADRVAAHDRDARPARAPA